MPTVSPQRGIKQTILQQYDRCQELKNGDSEMRQLVKKMDTLSREITQLISTLRGTDRHKTVEITSRLNELSDQHKLLKKEYDERMKSELAVLYNGWPEIYDKVIEGIDRDTLSHVLTMFEAVQMGQMSEDQAVSKGMDHIASKHNLPDDFFNKSAISQFNKKLKNNNK